MTDLDIDRLRQWIGSTETQDDIVTPRIVASLRATLEGVGGDTLPALHWCIAPQIEPMSALGEDGHPERGGFLPPVPLPNRMWASGELVIHGALKEGDNVRRTSRVADVEHKHGRSGPLCFVTVAHTFAANGQTAVEEQQHLVYRGAVGGGGTPVAPARAPQWSKEIQLSAALLFRYSALTFNTHRIHYDRDYCRAEGYAGLLVHGPLQASLLLHFATNIRGGQIPRRFDFRAVAPLVDDQGLVLNAAEAGAGFELWATDRMGRMTMTAKAGWP